MCDQAYFVRGALAIMLAWGFSTQSHAGGFQLRENSAAALGRAFAGAGSAPGDAAIVSNNPAGMRLQAGGRVVQCDLSSIDLDTHFHSQIATDSSGQVLTGGYGGNAGDVSIVGGAYFGTPITDSIRVGVFVDVPFGLSTEYDDRWIGRYEAVESDLRVVDLGVSFAYAVNSSVSVGVSVFAERADAELSRALDFGSLLGEPQELDGAVRIEGDDTTWGFKLGALFSVTDDTHVGVTYRAKVEHTLRGTGTFHDVPPQLQTSPTVRNVAASADLALPEGATVSVFHQLNDRWAVAADVSRTDWSSFDQLTVAFSDPNQTDATEIYDWHDTWGTFFGAECRMNARWLVRGGIGYDETPTHSSTRNARVPDADRRLIGLGLTYERGETLTFNLGYLHVFHSEPTVSTRSQFGQIVGDYDNTSSLLSMSMSYRL